MDSAPLTESDRIFRGACDFIWGADSLDDLPPASLPEIAFAGRSNVGKSSLVNALTGRKTLARTSHTPGRTQQLNFFKMADRFILVDMPGYGYAKVSMSQRKAWNKVMRGYLSGRATLRAVFLLIDSRHGLKDTDLEMMDMLGDAGVSCRIILTKSDEVKSAELNTTIQTVGAAVKKKAAVFPTPHPTSAHSGAGISELRTTVIELTG